MQLKYVGNFEHGWKGIVFKVGEGWRCTDADSALDLWCAKLIGDLSHHTH